MGIGQKHAGRLALSRTSVAFLGAALTAAMMCGPALAQSQQGSPDEAGTGLEEWRPTLKSADGCFTLTFRGRLQLDAGWFDQSQDVGQVNLQRDVQFKDLRSGLSNTVRMQIDYMRINVDRLNDTGQQVGQDLGAIGTRLQFTN